MASGFSIVRGSLSGYPDIAGMPPAVSMEITNHCNLHCPQCASGSEMMTRPRGFMELTLFTKVLNELKPYLYYVCLNFQGEPMLHRGFFSFLAAAQEMRTIVSTNGHFLTAENAEKLVAGDLWKLIVSLDGTDQETYSRYRVGGDFEKVIEGIRLVGEARKKAASEMKVEIQFLVNRYNEHQITGARKLAEKAGVKLSLKSMQILNNKNDENWLPSTEKFRRYSVDGSTYKVKSSLPDRCSRMYLNPVVTWDGKVVPCCFDKDGEYVMGDLTSDTFMNIWNGDKYAEFRKRVLTDRKSISICRNCTSGLHKVKC